MKNNQSMQLQSKRFVIRDFTPADTAAFLDYHSDPRNNEFYDTHETTREYAENLLSTFRLWAESHPRLNFQLAVVRRSPPCDLIGCVGLRTEGLSKSEAEFGIEIAPQYWGRVGYAIEIGNAMLEFGFTQMCLDRIIGRTATNNARIKKLAYWYGAEILAGESNTDEEMRWRLTRQQWLLVRGRYPSPSA